LLIGAFSSPVLRLRCHGRLVPLFAEVALLWLRLHLFLLIVAILKTFGANICHVEAICYQQMRMWRMSIPKVCRLSSKACQVTTFCTPWGYLRSLIALLKPVLQLGWGDPGGSTEFVDRQVLFANEVVHLGFSQIEQRCHLSDCQQQWRGWEIVRWFHGFISFPLKN
jgi:hypothetical protein